jgi:ribosomal protein S18 acetylase RimI-like enzyme
VHTGAPVRRLTDRDVGVAAATLGRAFLHDPLITYAIPDVDTRQQFLPTYFTPGVRLAQHLGEVWCTDDGSAVACWRRPGAGPPSTELLADAGVDQLPEPIASQAGSRANPVYEYLAARQEPLGVPSAHWYLSMIGVSPGYTRRGLGSAVMRPVLDAARARHESVYLETLAERNVGFYESNVFEAIERGVEPSSGLAYWLFLHTFPPV